MKCILATLGYLQEKPNLFLGHNNIIRNWTCMAKGIRVMEHVLSLSFFNVFFMNVIIITVNFVFFLKIISLLEIDNKEVIWLL